MKKLVLIIVLLVSPTFAFADTIGGLVGAGAGVALGTMIGGGRGTIAAEVILGLIGYNTGSRMEDGTYGYRNQPRVVAVPSGYPQVQYQPGYPQAQYQPRYYGGGYAGQGMADYAPGMCQDPQSGGQASCAEIANRGRINYAQPASYYPQPATRQVYYQQRGDSGPLIDRDRIAYSNPPVVQAQPQQIVLSFPTAQDYKAERWAKTIPPACKTGVTTNDSDCLIKEAEKLEAKAKECNCGSSYENPDFSYKHAANTYRILAADLYSTH